MRSKGKGGPPKAGPPDEGLPEVGSDVGLPEAGSDAGLPEAGSDAELPEVGSEESADALLEWLGRNDALTLGERVDRLGFLVRLNKRYGAGWIGFHNQAHEYLEYAARCYLEGLFVPCIIMCQAAAEEQMRGLLRSLGLEELVDRHLSEVLRDKRVRKAFGRPTVRQLEALRSRRNIYIHPPGPLDREGYLDSRWLPHRMAAQKKAAEEIYEGDAKAALRTVARFFTVTPEILGSGWGPSAKR